MNVSLYQAAAAMDGNIRWQQMIAENLAAGSTPAFKKAEISFHSIQAGLLGAGSAEILAKRVPTLLPAPSFGTNFSQGALQGTGSKLDLALDSPADKGFFKVRLPNGDIAYTRDGGYQIRQDGQMFDKHGNELLSDSDAVIQVNPRRQEDIVISPEGNVSQGEETRGKIGIVEFVNPQELKPIGGGYFTATPNAQTTPVTTTKVMQGFSEQANTVSTREVSALLLALRHYEANQKVIQMHDERMGRMIHELTATS